MSGEATRLDSAADNDSGDVGPGSTTRRRPPVSAAPAIASSATATSAGRGAARRSPAPAPAPVLGEPAALARPEPATPPLPAGEALSNVPAPLTGEADGERCCGAPRRKRPRDSSARSLTGDASPAARAEAHHAGLGRWAPSLPLSPMLPSLLARRRPSPMSSPLALRASRLWLTAPSRCGPAEAARLFFILAACCACGLLRSGRPIRRSEIPLLDMRRGGESCLQARWQHSQDSPEQPREARSWTRIQGKTRGAAQWRFKAQGSLGRSEGAGANRLLLWRALLGPLGRMGPAVVPALKNQTNVFPPGVPRKGSTNGPPPLWPCSGGPLLSEQSEAGDRDPVGGPCCQVWPESAGRLYRNSQQAWGVESCLCGSSPGLSASVL